MKNKKLDKVSGGAISFGGSLTGARDLSVEDNTSDTTRDESTLTQSHNTEDIFVDHHADVKVKVDQKITGR